MFRFSLLTFTIFLITLLFYRPINCRCDDALGQGRHNTITIVINCFQRNGGANNCLVLCTTVRDSRQVRKDMIFDLFAALQDIGVYI